VRLSAKVFPANLVRSAPLRAAPYRNEELPAAAKTLRAASGNSINSLKKSKKLDPAKYAG
jgi:hypothetical protein